MTDLEKDWLQAAQTGNDDAFSQLVEKYQSPVYNLCYRMLGNEVEAEDAAQETFWRAYQNIHRYDPSRSFITWLLSIAAHYCIDETRKRRHPTISVELLPEEDVPDYGPDPEHETGRLEERRMLRQLLNTLSPEDRSAIVLRYWYDFSEEEIAHSLSLTVSAVKSRLHRARLQLAQSYTHQQQPVKSVLKDRVHYESPAI